MKNILIILLVCAAGFAAISIIVALFSGSNDVVVDTEQQPIEYASFADESMSTETAGYDGEEIDEFDMMYVMGKNGQTGKAEVVLEPEDVEMLSNDFALLFEPESNEEANKYDIYYDDMTGLVMITLHETPLDAVRTMAVQRFSEKTGLSLSEMCDLNISVITNNFVSPEYAGFELGVPGCQGAILLNN